MPVENLLLIASMLLLISIVASKASGRLGVPALLMFLVIGMLAGSEGPGGIYFDDPWLAQLVGVVALAFILYDGGLSTEWQVIRPVFRKGISLSTMGVLVSTITVGLFANVVLNFSLIEGLLLGAIVSSTDAAAVFSILRSRDVRLKGRLEPLLELESGSNDPMAIFLTIGLTSLLVDPSGKLIDLVPMFFQQMALGIVLGFGLGKGMVFVVNRLKLGYEGLYPVLTVTLVLLAYGATASLGGNGFLAVYLTGLVMRNTDFLHRRSVMNFHDGLAWLMQIAMFLTLGLLVFPSQLIPVIGAGLLVSGFLILVARPASVFTSLLFSRMAPREKIMVSWVGLRGAAPIILATFPLVAGVPQANTIFNLVLFIVLTSVLFQGTFIMPVARWLKVDDTVAKRPFRFPLEFVDSTDLDNQLVEIKVSAGSVVVGKRIIDLHLPNGALVVLIGKGERFIVPSGGTQLDVGDRLMVLADSESLEKAKEILENNL
jgi:potassium/hydrogen antiporter